MAGLAVNVDHVATLREARKAAYPDPVAAAAIVEMAGADGVVVHLREDRRHIKDRDLKILKETVKSKLILEMAPTPEMIGSALEIKPDLVTFVPEKRTEVTTEGGMNLSLNQESIADAIETLKCAHIPVSIFIDPDPEQIRMAHKISAALVEIHTGGFCDAETPQQQKRAFLNIVNAAKLAKKLGLGVNAGHGLCYHTIKAFAGIHDIDEYSIGHSIISRAVMVGLDRAVRDMAALVRAL